METFSTSLKIVPKALAIKKFSNAMKAAAQKRSQVVKVLPKDVLPLVTSDQPPVSVVPRKGLVSGIPPITIPRYWGIPPSKEWGKTWMPVTRRIRALRPTEVGFFAALLNVVGAPVSVPAHIVGGMINLADRFRGQAEEERLKGPEDKIRDELLELKMRYEMDEISKDDFKTEETKLRKRLKDLEKGGVEKKATETSSAKSRAKRGERSLPRAQSRGRAVTGKKTKKKEKHKKKRKKG